MKTKYIYACFALLALANSCVKENGDEAYTIAREINEANSKTPDTEYLTIVTNVNGYMYGDARKDSIVSNSFETILNNNNMIKELNVYTTFYSEYQNLDLERNAIKATGYVYSRVNKSPVANAGDCQTTSCKSYNPSDSTKENIEFTQKIDGLDFNATYYVRSYVVSTNGDTLYNPRTMQLTTVLPEDVWFQRRDANVKRTEPFSYTFDETETTYIYGGKQGGTYFNDLWKYNKNNDTWEQVNTFNGEGTRYANSYKRANGAMFAYPNGKDVLLYIIGGETQNGEYTSDVIFYSTLHNEFCNKAHHPNYGKQFQLYNADGSPIYVQEQKVDDEGNLMYDSDGEPIMVDKEPKQQKLGDCSRDYVEPLPIYKENGNKRDYKGLAGMVAFTLSDGAMGTRYFVAFGKSDLTNASGVAATVYEYDVNNDRVCNGPNEDAVLTWKNLSAGNDKTAEGFYQPVCVRCGDRVIIGTGESSKGGVSKNFYQISWSTSTQNIRMELLPAVPDNFKARANAAAFYLNYEKEGNQYDRFYVGTGRTVTEDAYNAEPEQLLNDLWCYDFSNRVWVEKAECSNIVRQGAIGFTVTRNDDYYFNTFGENLRGYFSFGEGYNVKDGYGYLNDNWEYLP